MHLVAIILLLSSTTNAFEKSVVYSRTLDCNGKSGCALDNPNEYLEKVKSKLQCALICISSGKCVTYNYLEKNGSCLLFQTVPYKIIVIPYCSSFDGPDSNYRKPGDNLSKFRRSCQSTTYVGRMSWLAVDDVYAVNADMKECSHTSEGDTGNNWFMVDLVQFVTIQYVRILARSSVFPYVKRYDNLTVGVTNVSWLISGPIRNTYPLCGVYLGPPVNAIWFQIDCQPSLPSARFTIVYQAFINHYAGGFLSLCELQVWFQNRRAKYRKQEKQPVKTLAPSSGVMAGGVPCIGIVRFLYQPTPGRTCYPYPNNFHLMFSFLEDGPKLF